MKKRYLGRRNLPLIGSPQAAVYAVVAGLVLVVLAVRFIAPGALTLLVTPLWQFGSAGTAAVHSSLAVFANPLTLATQRDALVAENASLATENRALAARLADISAIVPAPETIKAGVLARPPVSPYDVLLVDVGTTSGVAVGALAYGPGGAPVGTVTSVTAGTAQITLLSAPGIVTEGWLGESRIPVTFTGAGAGAFDATISREASTTVGAVVYAPGPGALPVGTVKRIDTDPSSPTATLRIQGAVNPFSLTWVGIRH